MDASIDSLRGQSFPVSQSESIVSIERILTAVSSDHEKDTSTFLLDPDMKCCKSFSLSIVATLIGLGMIAGQAQAQSGQAADPSLNDNEPGFLFTTSGWEVPATEYQDANHRTNRRIALLPALNQENDDQDELLEKAAQERAAREKAEDLRRRAREREETDRLMEDLESSEDDRPIQKAAPFGDWPRKSIRSTRIDVREHHSTVPEDQSFRLTSQPVVMRGSSEKVFAWTAPNIKYQPLYFEDIAVERYGQTCSPYRQSFYGAARFLKSAIAMPYAMTIDHPYSCDHPLGFCRPGSQAPCVKQAHFFSR